MASGLVPRKITTRGRAGMETSMTGAPGRRAGAGSSARDGARLEWPGPDPAGKIG